MASHHSAVHSYDSFASSLSSSSAEEETSSLLARRDDRDRDDSNVSPASAPPLPGRRRLDFSASSVLKTMALALVLFAASTTLFQLLLNSHADYERDLPWLGMSFRKYEAQRIANNYLQYLVMSDDDNDDEGSGGKNKRIKHDHHHHNHTAFAAPDGCEGTVVILRHCEKGNIREHCSYAGYERAAYLATLFGDDDERWPMPSYVYALDPAHRSDKKKRNFREVETVQPLADKASVPVKQDYDTGTAGNLARELFSKLKTGDMCGKIAVVAWKHSDIPHLAHKLGCGPNDGCPEDYSSKTFDQAWQIKFVYQKMMHSEFKSGWLPKRDMWQIYGSAQWENFDPLSFSKKSGDYVPGGTPYGARWRNPDDEVPERMVFKYSEKNAE